jgi:hypothetical protein
MIGRIARDMALACLVIAIIFFIWKRDAASPLGVLGGGVLIGMSFWAIRGTVDALVALRTGGETGRISTLFVLVKFFTRHAIVALAAYGMMVRLHLDPLGLLAGVTSLGVAVGVEALRDLRWRRFL